MFIEKVKNYEGDDGPIRAFEKTLEDLRARLRRMAKYGLRGAGSSTIREGIGNQIREVKDTLIAMGAYRRSKEWG